MKNKIKTEFGVRAQVKSIRSKFRKFARVFPAKVNEASEAIKKHFDLIKLSAQIRGEIEPTIVKNQEAWDSLFGKKHEAQDFVFDLKKYSEYAMVNEHRMGHNEPDALNT